MKNIKLIFSVVSLAVLFAFFLTSCKGDGEASSSKGLNKNEVIGNIPSIIYQFQQKDSVLDAKSQADFDKIKEKADEKKIKVLYEKYQKQKEALAQEKESIIEKEKSVLVGKQIPYEMEEALGFEVTNFVIKDIDKDGQIEAEFEVKLTNPSIAQLMGYSTTELVVSTVYVNKSDEVFGSPSAFYVPLDSKEIGATGTYKSYIHIRSRDAKDFVEFAKLRFVKI